MRQLLLTVYLGLLAVWPQDILGDEYQPPRKYLLWLWAIPVRSFLNRMPHACHSRMYLMICATKGR